MHHSKVTEWCVSSRGRECENERERDAMGCFFNIKWNWIPHYLTCAISQAAPRLLMESCDRIGSVFPFFNFTAAPKCCVFVSLLIHGWSIIPPPVHCGCVLCYWVRWIYQGWRVGQFTHQGDNYRVIGLLALSALSLPPLFSPRPYIQHVWHWKSTKKLLGPGTPALSPVHSPGSAFKQLCLFIRKHVHHCLQMFVDLLELRRPLTSILHHRIFCYY